MKKILFIVLLSFTVDSLAQNTITVRKSDTTFNSFFYSSDIKAATFKNQSTFFTKKKTRVYYVFGTSGDVWYFSESTNYRKVKKWCDAKDWTQQQPNGKYYIKETDLVIFPYVRQIDGSYSLGKVPLDGSYFGSFLEMEMGSDSRKMILFD